MAPIRVLHILHSMNRGGIENFIMNQYRNVDRSKVQFDFLLRDPARGAFDDEIEAMGGRIYRMPRLTLSNPFRYVKAVDRFFKEHGGEYTICHSHMNATSAIPLWVAKRNGIKYRISHSHTVAPYSQLDLKKKCKVFGLKLLPLKKMATHLFACSNDAGVWLFGKKAVENGEVKIVRNSIDLQRFDYNPAKRIDMRQTLQAADSTLVVGHIGRFVRQKNHKFAIDILAELVKIVPDTKFVFLGDGPLKPGVEQYAKERGVGGNCLFSGTVPNVGDYVQAMDAFCFPSRHEGLGMVAIEAQTSGLKCYVSENVPQECKVTDLVDFLPLSDGAERWAKAVAKARSCNRYGRTKEVGAAGYDVAVTARWLQDFYLRLSEPKETESEMPH